MTALEFLIEVHHFGAGGFWSIENPKRVASHSELRNWIAQNQLEIDGKIVKAQDEMIPPFTSVILFPRIKPGKPSKRITLL